jgi:alpha-mannosidase
MWVEPDVTLPSGEWLVRQLAIGIRLFEKEMGRGQTVLVLPDCFTFPASLPQILLRSGIDSLLTAKISWCEYTHFPHSTFVCGGDVLTHFVTTPRSTTDQAAAYAGKATAFEFIAALRGYKQKDELPTSALHMVGHGDRGGGITDEMAWNLNTMAELPKLQGVPRVVFPTVDKLFAESRAKKNELEDWDDELYLEYHRGTLTTQGEVKRQNRLLEAHLHNVEWLIAILTSDCNRDLAEITNDVQQIWEATLLIQFHDAIPGTSINEANQDIIKRGRRHLRRLREMENELATALSRQVKMNDSATLIFNTLAHPRFICSQLIPSGGWTSKHEQMVSLLDEQPTTTHERIAKGELIRVRRLVEPFIDATIPPGRSELVNIHRKTMTVTTPFIVVTVNENGTIRSVRGAKTGRDYLSGPGNHFELYEDRPIAYPAEDIQLYHKEMQIQSPIFDSMTFEADRSS